MDASDLKDQGNEAFRGGDYRRAIALYTESLEQDRSNATCYHNRAVCKLKLGDYAGAVTDADEALSWKRDYAKAFSTKGSALLQLKRYAEAAAVFRQGLEIDPTLASLKTNLQHAEELLAGSGSAGRAHAGASSSSSSSSSSGSGSRRAPSAGSSGSSSAGSPSSSSSSGSSGSTLVWGIPMPPTALGRVIILARVALLLLLLAYITPLVVPGWLKARAYTGLLLLASATHTADLLRRFGTPQRSPEYLSRVASDPFFHTVFLPLAFVPATPNLAVALVTVDFDVLHALEFLHAAAVKAAPAVAVRMEGAALAALPYVLQRQAAEVARRTVRERWDGVNAFLMAQNAFVEVVIGLMLLLQLLLPSRALMTTLAVWQLLQFRWMTSQHTRDAFGAVDAAVGRVTGHPSCPALVAKGYGQLRAFLRSRVKTPEEAAAAAAAANGGAPARPSCAVM